MDDLFGPLEETLHRSVSIGSPQPYEAFRTIHEPLSVLYPASAHDATPATVFKKTTFVDTDEAAIRTLKTAGYRAHHTDIRDYRAHEPHDLLILLNPEVPASWATPHLALGGYVLANDYNGSASELNETEGFELIATIDHDGVSRDLEGLFEPIDMDELARERPESFQTMRTQRDIFIEEGMLDARADDTEELKWRSFFKATEIPLYRRTAPFYVFQKNG
ncbi:MAG: hypothetical protein ACMXYM_05815 [Candidatus Woesearchaeota archaeon]